MAAIVATAALAVPAGCAAFGGDSNGTEHGLPYEAGATADAGAATDADTASDGDAAIDGEASPRAVQCGPTECTGTQNCCLDANDAGCSSTRCLASAVTIQCDDTADCPSGLVCCVNHQNQTLQGSSCVASCSDGFRACAPNVPGECGPGKGCATYTTRFNGGSFVPDYPFFLCDP